MRKTIYTNISFLLAIAMMALTSCRKTNSGDVAPISFGVQTTEMKAGTGSTVTNNDNLTGKAFGVSGVVTNTNGDFNTSNVFNGDRVEVSYVSSWEYSPEAYWKINKWYRFRAYHPYEGSSINVQAASGDNLTIEYSTVSGQDDLLVGFNHLQANPENIVQRVPIVFKHALSALQFKIAFKNVADIADDYSDQITAFCMTGVSPMGTMVYSHQDGNPLTEELRWLPSFYDETEFYEWTGSKLFHKINAEKTNATIVYDTDGDKDGLVFVIPQTCSRSDAEPTMVHFKTKKGGSALHSAKLPQITWTPGNIYVYTLLVNKSDITISVTIKPWTELESNETIYL